MKINFKGQLMKTTLWILSGFVILFMFRFIYGFTTQYSDSNDEFTGNFFSDFEFSRRNYAKDVYKYGGKESNSHAVSEPKNVTLNQMYEKIATVASKTSKFEEDEKAVKNTIKRFNSIIQYEENKGNKGSREIHLLVGVKPEKFDSFYVAIQKFGIVKVKEITKTDMTNEYLKLNAQRTSLEKTRNSLIELKRQSGKIEEYVNLENRILEIEDTLQGLGVSLGSYDEENELCTIRYSLEEGKEKKSITFLHRIKVAFEWTLSNYLKLILIIMFSTFSAFFVLLIIDKLKMFSGIIKKFNDSNE